MMTSEEMESAKRVARRVVGRGLVFAGPDRSKMLELVKREWLDDDSRVIYDIMLQMDKEAPWEVIQHELTKIGRAHLAQSIYEYTDEPAVATEFYHYLKILSDSDIRYRTRCMIETIQGGLSSGLDIDSVIHYASESLKKIDEGRAASAVELVKAEQWQSIEPEQSNPVIMDFLDMGDKMAIIAPSKTRKSFFTLQLCIAIAGGVEEMMGFRMGQSRKVLLVNLEIRAAHLHRRFRRMSESLGLLDDETIGKSLMFVNARDARIRISMSSIRKAASKHKAEVVVIDPLYKIFEGVENDADAMKAMMDEFDLLSKETGAAVVYIHHDAKGQAGDRALQDRGSGSGVVGRDYDAAIYLTAHKSEHDALVIETMSRNYPPREAAVLKWWDGRFEKDSFICPEKASSSSARVAQGPRLDSAAVSVLLLANGPMGAGDLAEKLAGILKVSERKAKDIIAEMVDAEIITKSEREGKGGKVNYSLPEKLP
jgi:hypothetical protein